MQEKGASMMELYIETLTGTAFELRVHPGETVQDIKARIQKMEGIPISQQHLIWDSTELEDDYCLSDYNIQDRSTLKLVLTLRGGPINTRRIPMDDQNFIDGGDFSEYNGDDVTESIDAAGQPFTVIVCHDGGQLKFFKVVDRDALSPQDVTASSSSEDTEGKAKTSENNIMRQKMKSLRLKMEKVHLDKKLKKVVMPLPPAHGRPGSKRLNRHHVLKKPVDATLLATTDVVTSEVLNSDKTAVIKNVEKVVKLDENELQNQNTNYSFEKPHQISKTSFPREHCLHSIDNSIPNDKKDSLSILCGSKSLINDVERTAASDEANVTNDKLHLDLKEKPLFNHGKICSQSTLEFSPSVLLKRDDQCVSKEIAKKTTKLLTLNTVKDTVLPATRPMAASACGIHHLERVLENEADSSSPERPLDKNISSFQRRSPLIATGRRAGVVVESLDPSEVHGVISSIVRSAGKSKFSLIGSARHNRSETSNSSFTTLSRQPVPSDQNLIPIQVPVVLGVEASSSYELPPVKLKRKVSSRCFFCGKRTGLATSYQCRCGNNFCATHRYAEAHGCSFDYKSEGRKLLEQNNPVVTAPKLPKI